MAIQKYFGRIFIVEFVSEIGLQREGGRLKGYFLVLLPFYIRTTRLSVVIYSVLNITTTVSFGPSVFSKPNNALRYTDRIENFCHTSKSTAFINHTKLTLIFARH